MVQVIALVSASLFAGAAIYINVAEHPARMKLDMHPAAAQWASSYGRATWMQAPLAILSGLAGAGAWWLSGGVIWLVAALFVGAVVPFTLVAIMPTNRRLMQVQPGTEPAEIRQLLDRWNRLHAVRSALSALAAAIMAEALVAA